MTDTSPPIIPDAADIVAFWRDAGPDRWFTQDAAFDAVIRARFLPAYDAAVGGRLPAWEAVAEGALALTLVFDQFPRNMFRGTARAFAADPVARDVAVRAIGRGHDQAVGRDLRAFFYLPFMHSEDLADQEHCISLYAAAGNVGGLRWAEIHADIIRRFGRFPHRNAVLGRATTADEQAFLDAGGFSG